jgi:monothiol glutaredoxin
MGRSILDEAHIHAAIRESIADNHADIVLEVQAAISQNEIVIVGMAQNPMP